MVKKHLLNHGTMNQEILKLLFDIAHMFAEQLHGLSGDKVLEGIAGALGKLNPLDQVKIASSPYALVFIVIICLFFFFFLLFLIV